MAKQSGFWFRKAKDSLHVWTTPPVHVEASLAELKRQIDEGQLPLIDPEAMNAWLENNSHQISGALAQWYDQLYAQKSGERDPWTLGYEQTNGLFYPMHAGLLREYLQTRDPEAWEALRASLLISPWRARTNSRIVAGVIDSQEHTRGSGARIDE